MEKGLYEAAEVLGNYIVSFYSITILVVALIIDTITLPLRFAIALLM